MVDLVSLRTDGIEYVKKAVELEDANKNEEAIKFYNKAINNFKLIIEQDSNKYNKETYAKKLAEYEDRVKYLKELIEHNEKKDKKVKVGGK